MSTPPTPTTPTTPIGSKFTLERRLLLRTANLTAKKCRPSEEDLAQLDSSLKKNTAFIKRLKNITAEHLESIAAEFIGLKLSKYMTEVTTSIFESKLKNAGDICAFVEIVSLFHQRYEEFHRFFLEKLGRQLIEPEPKDAEERVIWLTKQRQLLRLTAELFLVGIIGFPGYVLEFLQRLLPEDDINGPLHVPVATNFVKGVGAYFLTLNLTDHTAEEFLPSEWRSKFHEALTKFFKAMTRLLVRNSGQLRVLESRGRRHYETRGDLSPLQTSQLQETSESVEKLCANLQALADLLNLSLPELREAETPQFLEGKIVFADPSIKLEDKTSVIYDSEEDRSFYEDLINLRERVPEILLPGVSSVLDSPMDSLDSSLEDLSGIAGVDPDSVAGKPINENLSPEDHKSARNIAAFFEKLPSMQSRSLADQAAIDFCFINSKSMRRRLSDTLIDLPHKRFDLLPFIGRLLATLKPYFPDVSTAVYESLVGQFIFLFHRPEPIMGTRSRICRYIGELTKFRVMPQTRTYAMLRKTVLEDLTGFNIDMTSILLEACGRFLYNQAESHKRLIHLFDVINKKKNQGMGHYQVVMLDNAMYISNPPDHIAILKKEKSSRLKYLFHLLRTILEPANSEHVFKQIRRFPWKEEECREELMGAFLKVWKIKYGNIPLLAAMMGSLSKIYPSFSIDLVDRLFEEIRLALERNSSKFNQRLTSAIKYVGELFCYNVIEADMVFFTLHQLVTLGHPGVPRINSPSPVDSPDNHFRIRLICILLHTCATFLTEPQLSDPVESFMVLFEYYIATKTKLPMDVDYLVYDTYEELDRKRPANHLSEVILRLVKASNGALSFLLDDSVDEPESILESDDGQLEEHAIMNSSRDDGFDKALAGMITTSLEERKLERRIGAFDAHIPLSPLSLKSPSQGNLAMKLLVKKKNKTVTKELFVDPSKVSFIHSSLVGKEKEIAEQQKVKRLVLATQYTEDVPTRGLAQRRQRDSNRTTFNVYGHRRIDS